MKMYQLSEMKHSRIFFDKNPPRFIHAVGVIILCLCIVTIFGMYTVQKSYYVKGAGTFEYTDRTYISVKSAGVVSSILKHEGDEVEKGTLLFTLSSGVEGIQSIELQKQIQAIEEKDTIYALFEKSLNENKNYMQNSGLQQAYYGKVELYLSQYKTDEITKKSNQEKVETKKKEQKNLEEEVKKLKGNVEEEANYESKNTTLQSLTEEIKSLEQGINDNNIQSKQYKNQFLSELGVERSTNETKRKELESQYNIQVRNDETLRVYSESSGKIHYSKDLELGMNIQLGEIVGQVSGGKSGHLQAEVYIAATDRTKVNINDVVKIAISGVNQSKYGTLNGYVQSISDGTYVQETTKGQVMLYKIIINTRETKLQDDKKHEKISVQSSLPIEGRIVYDKETYLEWLMGLLNFKE